FYYSGGPSPPVFAARGPLRAPLRFYHSGGPCPPVFAARGPLRAPVFDHAGGPYPPVSLFTPGASPRCLLQGPLAIASSLCAGRSEPRSEFFTLGHVPLSVRHPDRRNASWRCYLSPCESAI